MNRLPDPLKPTAPQAGQPHDPESVANELMASVNRAIAEELAKPYVTSFRDKTSTPTIGSMPPHPQPGRAPMSQKASDASGLILSVGVASPLVGGGIALALWGTGQANPTVIAWIAGGAVALVVAATAFLKTAKTAVEAAPPVIHQYFTGTTHIDHSSHEHTSRGVWVRNHNDHSTNL